MKDPKALFLGPYSENQSEFRKMMDFVLNDVIQWRRNYHPSDERLIRPEDKESNDWKKTSQQLERELDILLGDMKRSIPFHNPRFIGHMHSDLLMPAIIGYFIGQLYNQNNVVGESSPVTTEKEVQFIDYLCQMIHYPLHEFSKEAKEKNSIYSTGHLTGGGTIANIESVWTARNIKYYPLSLKLLMYQHNEDEYWKDLILQIRDLTIGTNKISEISCKELFNVSPSTVFDLRDAVKETVKMFINKLDLDKSDREAKEEEFSNLLNQVSVRSMGVHGIHAAVEKIFHEKIELPFLILPQSRHYSWEKAMDILGLGSGQIKYVKVDNDFRISIEEFEKVCRDTANILMAVAVVGTTEEGVVDPVAGMIKKKNEMKKGFWFHLDAAYGGYYAAAFNTASNDFISKTDVNSIESITGEWLSNSLEDFEALQYADSITIDPHKMGYIPYAVGAILYRDNRSNFFINKKAPYLSAGNEDFFDPTQLYIGGSSIEGSRSGAAALACYMSAKTVPNNIEGYGHMLRETFINAKSFLNKMKHFNSNQDESLPLQIVLHPIYDSLTNLVCYGIGVKDIKLTPEIYNQLNDALYKEMSAENNKLVNDYKFIISKTSLDFEETYNNPGYAEHIISFLSKFNINAPTAKGYKLNLIRSTLINPLLSHNGREYIFRDYFNYVRLLVNKLLPRIVLENALKKNDFKRFKILWIENQERVEKLKNAILSGKNQILDISKFLEFEFVPNLKNEVNLSEYSTFIVDLNLEGTQHDEWDSGIEAIEKIKDAKESPTVLVYSRFINEEFNLQFDAANNSTRKENISKHLIGNFGIEKENLIAKSVDDNGNYTTDNPIEMKDLDLIIKKLAFNILQKNTI